MTEIVRDSENIFTNQEKFTGETGIVTCATGRESFNSTKEPSIKAHGLKEKGMEKAV